MIEEDLAGLLPHQNIVPSPKELSLLSHEELLPLLEKLVGYSMESFTKQLSSDGKYPKHTLTGSVLAYFLDWYANQLFQKESYNMLFRNLKDSLLELCTDLDSIACEKLIWWLEETYVNYISETLNKKVSKFASLIQITTLPVVTEPINCRYSLLGKFQQLLKEANINNVDEKVIEKIATHFPYRALLAESPSSAANLYNLVCNLPSTTTRSTIEKETGIKLNEVFDPNGSDYIIPGTLSGKPILVKILVGTDIENEIAAVNHLNEKPCPTLVPTRVCSVKLQGHATFQCLVMPHYPSSLDKLTKLLNDEDILSGGKRMLAALEFIHSRNMVHMDIKPANIFVSTEGDWFLGDFGSCVEYNDVIRSCSESYLPKKVIGKRAEYGYDFFMLAISLLSLKVELQTMFLKNTKLIDDNKVVKSVSELEHTELQFMIQSLLDKSKTAFVG